MHEFVLRQLYSLKALPLIMASKSQKKTFLKHSLDMRFSLVKQEMKQLVNVDFLKLTCFQLLLCAAILLISATFSASSPINEFFKRERDILSKRRELLAGGRRQRDLLKKRTELLAKGLLSYLPPAKDDNDTDVRILTL